MTTFDQNNGFYLYTSNRTESLLECLATFIECKNSSGRDIFEKSTFLIQSQGMERMISQAMSSHFGSWCNYSYYSPVKFLELIANHLAIEQTSEGYQREQLLWQFDALLSRLDDAELTAVHRYIAGENGSLKRFQLARQLANIFDQYQLMRPDLLEKWAVGETRYDHEAEIWQMHLWNSLQTELAPQKHRGTLVMDIIEALNSGASFASLPRDFYIFGLHIMAPLFLQLLTSLSSHVRVHLFLLSPCREYWGDVETKRQAVRRAVSAAGAAVDQLHLIDVEYHPLLRAYGQQGRLFQEMLLESVDFNQEIEAYKDHGRDTLLHALQQDLLDNRIEPEEDPAKWVMDGSIEIVSCHSRFREIMVLRDHILRTLNEDHTLKLREIVVMAPDIQEYVPFIEAIFHDIHHSIADRSSRKRNAVFAAFSSFLHLFTGRFGWNEVLELLKLPVIHSQFDLSPTDLENLQRWVVNSGIRWGLSASQRSDDIALPAFDENSWQAGLDRILLGYAMQGDVAFQGVIPFQDIEGGSARGVGGLIEFIEIISALREQLKRPKLVTEWVDLFLEACDDLFGQQDSRDLLELRSILTDLKEKGDLLSQLVEFELMLDWFDHAAREARTSSGFLRGQITFCSMLPMRSIPFKMVCLIGLNDGEFPKRDQFATFDLMGVEQRRGDRSARNDDRYQFLEAILAAREKLYLSYVGQSIKTNEQIPPSVVVTELVEVLQHDYQVDEPVTMHPLQPFSHRYFDGQNQKLYSYDQDYCRLAKQLLQDCEQKEAWWQGKLDFTEETIRFDELLRFFTNPQGWFIRNRMGIDLRLEDNSPDENELFGIDKLTKYQVNQALISGLGKNLQPDELLTPFQASGNWPASVPGKIKAKEAAGEVEQYLLVIERLGVGAACDDVEFTLDVAGVQLVGRLDNLYTRGLVLVRFGKLRGVDILRTWLYFMIAQKVLQPALPVYLITEDKQYVLKPEHEAGLMQLEQAVHYFIHGSEEPWPLYVEPAYEYVKQQHGRGSIAPMQKAVDKLSNDLAKGYQPELELLLNGIRPEAALAGEFEQLTGEIMDPVWRAFLGK